MSVTVCSILSIICTVIAVVLLYVLVLPKSKDGNLGGFLQFLHNFLNIKKLYLEAVVKLFYILSTVGCVFTGFFLLFGKIELGWTSRSTALIGLGTLVLGPIALRLSFELLMLSIILVKNVIEINNSLNKKTQDIGFASDGQLTEKFSQKATDYAQAVSAANAQIKAQHAAEQAAPAEAPQTKTCPSCGNTLPADAKFCNKCGQQV